MQTYQTAGQLQRSHFPRTRTQLNGVIFDAALYEAEKREKAALTAQLKESDKPLARVDSSNNATEVRSPIVSAEPVRTAELVAPGEPIKLKAPVTKPQAESTNRKTPLPKFSKHKPLKISTKVTAFLSAGIVGLAVVLAVILFLPSMYYKIFPGEAVPVMPASSGTPLGGSFTQEPVAPSRYEPPFDPNLPEGDWISIPRIGVRTELRETADPDEALNEGVWWVPDFGQPGDLEEPMIVAAHRYGWKWWWNTLTDPEDPQSLYALRNSFYKLPDTEPGDVIEIISGQRKYIYEIYAGEENNEITDYQADLILYTCKFLNSPIRHVRYARLINPELNTQGIEVSSL